MPNVFLIGRPGSGKSLVYKLLSEKLRTRGFQGELKRIDDFPVLKRIFETDREFKRHRPAPGGGLKITDEGVWDELTDALNQQALKLQSKDRLIFIEFSRGNYLRAFRRFAPKLLRNSLIIYVDSPFELCWERNVARVRKEKGPDAHLVSKEEMELTYLHDDHEELAQAGFAPMLVIDNRSNDLKKLEAELERAADEILKLIGG